MHRSPRSVPPRRRPRAWIPAIAALAFVASARADTVVIPVSEDSAPYSFVPGLARGGSPTLYAFRALDESSTAHEFATHLWFDVTQADLPVGHVLTQATLVVTYAFDFTGFGGFGTSGFGPVNLAAGASMGALELSLREPILFDGFQIHFSRLQLPRLCIDELKHARV